MPQIIDRTDFACTDVDASQWPKLSCGGANLLTLADGSFQLESDRFLAFADNGQIRSFDDTHRLVFNRAANLLELHEAGDIRFLTGAPTPTERLRIRTDGNLQVTGNLAVSGNLSAGERLSIDSAGTLRLNAGGGLRVTVPNATDQIRFSAEDDSAFAQLELHATLATISGNLAVSGDLTVTGTIQGALAASTVGTTQLTNGAVSTDKIANNAVTISKLAAGVLPPAIGVAMATGLQHGEECVFFVALKYLLVEPANGRTIYNCVADSKGKVSITPDGYAVAVGVALGKKGGW